MNYTIAAHASRRTLGFPTADAGTAVGGYGGDGGAATGVGEDPKNGHIAKLAIVKVSPSTTVNQSVLLWTINAASVLQPR